ncbi:MAG TPA: glycosyltransferase family 39 protein, partial [Bacteroidia bacterium]|nr:glycosyltransferase family 39 protein [Bacteroidia bacterium]
MKEAIKKTWEKHPLVIIILSALFFRIIAVIFSKGFGFHDDHFLVIEPAQSWIEGYDYNNWLPQNSGKDYAPEGPSLFYPGIHYLILLYFKWRGITDPQGKMYIIRALHALYSLIIVVYGFKIARHYAGDKVAKQVGLLLAVYWFIPMLSVHNLVEMVCIPPLIVATWLMINPESNQKASTYFWVGVLCAIACNIRFQSALFVGGMGLYMLFNKKWKYILLIALGFILVFSLFQGGIDMFIWHHPFAEFTEYIKYNIENAHNYIIGPWYNYFLLVGGMLLPPVGLFLIFGFARSFRKYPLLFWPSFLFFAFHSFFPNKQERFILPIIP